MLSKDSEEADKVAMKNKKNASINSWTAGMVLVS